MPWSSLAGNVSAADIVGCMASLVKALASCVYNVLIYIGIVWGMQDRISVRINICIIHIFVCVLLYITIIIH